MDRLIRLAFCASAAATIMACAPTAPTPTIVQVTLFPSGVLIGIGQSVQIVPTVKTNPSGSAYSIVWTSSTSDIVVDSTGRVTGVALTQDASVCANVRAGDTSSVVQTCAAVVVTNQTYGPSRHGLLPSSPRHIP